MGSIKDEKSVIEHLLQDMQVKLRDMDDFVEGLHYKKILSKFHKGYKEEYTHS